MPGRMLRSVCTAALAAATALAATAAATAGPDDSSSPDGAADASVRRASSPSATASGSAAAEPSAASHPPAPESRPGPAAHSIAGLLTRLQELYRQAEEAAEAYTAAEELREEQHAETKRLGSELAEARNALARSRRDAGRLARLQYQGRSELSLYLHLLLARSPQQALDQGHLMERAARDRVATMARLTRLTLRADALATASRKALDEQQSLAEKQRRQRDTLRARLKDVEELLASLSAQELAALGAPSALERGGTEAGPGRTG
ncbi:hypothetical protein ACWCXB_01585 [Streptomyces sp. NPDC001514]